MFDHMIQVEFISVPISSPRSTTGLGYPLGQYWHSSLILPKIHYTCFLITSP